MSKELDVIKTKCKEETWNEADKRNDYFRKQGKQEVLKEILEIHQRLSGKIGSWATYDKCFRREIKKLGDKK